MEAIGELVQVFDVLREQSPQRVVTEFDGKLAQFVGRIGAQHRGVLSGAGPRRVMGQAYRV